MVLQKERFLTLGVAKDEVLCVAMMDQIEMDQMRMDQIVDCQHTFEKLKLIKSKVIRITTMVARTGPKIRTGPNK